MLRDRLLRVPPIAAPAPGEPVAQVRAAARIMLPPAVAFLSNGKRLHGTRQRNAASGCPVIGLHKHCLHIRSSIPLKGGMPVSTGDLRGGGVERLRNRRSYPRWRRRVRCQMPS
jgi:hypothetical protein